LNAVDFEASAAPKTLAVFCDKTGPNVQATFPRRVKKIMSSIETHTHWVLPRGPGSFEGMKNTFQRTGVRTLFEFWQMTNLPVLSGS
jgi:hypothetical protein